MTVLIPCLSVAPSANLPSFFSFQFLVDSAGLSKSNDWHQFCSILNCVANHGVFTPRNYSPIGQNTNECRDHLIINFDYVEYSVKLKCFLILLLIVDILSNAAKIYDT